MTGLEASVTEIGVYLDTSSSVGKVSESSGKVDVGESSDRAGVCATSVTSEISCTRKICKL